MNHFNKVASSSFKNWIPVIRKYGKKVSFDDIHFREATLCDKEAVLNLRHNVYRGLDYLPDYFDYFLQDTNRKCIVGELNNEMVTFGVMLMLDGGSSVLSQAGRVHEKHEEMGIFSALNKYVNQTARERGCVRRVALVETSLNKYARSERFRQTHVIISSKLHYAGLVTKDVREKLTSFQILHASQTDIPRVVEHDLGDMINTTEVSEYLFPSGRILLDFIPYRCQTENVALLRGKNTEFCSTVRKTEAGVKGLMSASSNYKCSNPPGAYTIDVFGADHADLKEHIHFHLTKAMKQIPGVFCLQIFVEKGFISQELCNTLISLDIPKCNWYVEGGVTTKTIVEEHFQ